MSYTIACNLFKARYLFTYLHYYCLRLHLLLQPLHSPIPFFQFCAFNSISRGSAISQALRHSNSRPSVIDFMIGNVVASSIKVTWWSRYHQVYSDISSLAWIPAPIFIEVLEVSLQVLNHGRGLSHLGHNISEYLIVFDVSAKLIPEVLEKSVAVSNSKIQGCGFLFDCYYGFECSLEGLVSISYGLWHARKCSLESPAWIQHSIWMGALSALEPCRNVPCPLPLFERTL